MPFERYHIKMMIITITTTIWWAYNWLNIKKYISHLSERRARRRSEKLNWKKKFYDCNKAKLSLNWLISELFLLALASRARYRDFVSFSSPHYEATERLKRCVFYRWKRNLLINHTQGQRTRVSERSGKIVEEIFHSEKKWRRRRIMAKVVWIVIFMLVMRACWSSSWSEREKEDTNIIIVKRGT